MSSSPTSPTFEKSIAQMLTGISVTNSETWEKDKKYTVYKVMVTAENKSWFIFRRYNEFCKLNDILKKRSPHVTFKLPGKKLFGSNFSSDFIRNRRQGLNDFVQKLVSEPELLDDPDVRAFLNIDRNYQPNGISEDHSEDLDSPQSPNYPGLDFNGTDEKPINLGPSEQKHSQPSDFEFLKVIGKGSFGKVLLAKHKGDDTIYAVKVLQKKMILKKNEKAHIMCERNVLLKNLNHPFLVGLKFSFQSKDKLYFVLDYVNGGELFFHLQRERVFPESRARFYAAEITSALGYLHSQSIIYRDLKPENILLDKEGHIILTDFGLCKDGIEGSDTTTTFCGTPEYLAPEVLKKEAYDKAVDWWCLGSVLYEMLFGLPPFYSRDVAQMYQDIMNKPLRIRSTVPEPAKNILEGLLQKQKDKRLGSQNDVEEIKSHEFFKNIDWDALDAKKIKPPYNPNVKGSMDLKNIDPEFTREPVPASVGKSQGMSASVQDTDNAFLGFSYAPPMFNSE